MEGALTTLPRVQAVPPVRNTSASSMLSPPASADATSVIILSPVLARPGARPRSKYRSTSWGRPRCKANVAGRISPALLTRRWSSKAMRMRSGWWRGSIYWVLLVSGWFSISKTIIPDAQEHFLTHSTRRDTHLFGGFGLMEWWTIHHRGALQSLARDARRAHRSVEADDLSNMCVLQTIPWGNPLYYIRGFEFRAISGLGRIGGGGGLVSDFEHHHHVVHMGLGRASWQGTQGLPPHHFDGLSARPGAPVSRRPPRNRAHRGHRA